MAEPNVTFTAELLANGKTATGIAVPPEAIDTLGAGKRPPVRVTINGYTYRNTVGAMGGVPMLSVSAEHRAGAGIAAGDVVAVEMTLDTEPRDVAVPEDLAAALGADASAKAAFEALSYSRKQQLVLPIETAKAAETRARRVQAAIAALTP